MCSLILSLSVKVTIKSLGILVQSVSLAEVVYRDFNTQK